MFKISFSLFTVGFPMLPTTLSGSKLRIPEFFRRVGHHDQMEIDSALSQMWSLLTSPSAVFKISKARKMTKNHYYRDDPGFLIVQFLFLAATTVAFGLAVGASIITILYNILYQIGIDYITVGALLATATWSIANKLLMTPGHLHEVRRDVEWQYAFDIHCNSYFPYFMLTHVFHFIILPLLVKDLFFAQFLANCLYGAGFCCYFFVTFRGYLELPMLSRQQVFLYPIVVVVTFVTGATFVTNTNFSHVILRHVWAVA